MRATIKDGIFVLSRVPELSREWGQELYVAQLDLTKAFDRVKHSAVINALKMQRASHQCIAVFSAMMQCTSLAFRLEDVTSSSFGLQRGLPQGAPDGEAVPPSPRREPLHAVRQPDT